MLGQRPLGPRRRLVGFSARRFFGSQFGRTFGILCARSEKALRQAAAGMTGERHHVYLLREKRPVAADARL